MLQERLKELHDDGTGSVVVRLALPYGLNLSFDEADTVKEKIRSLHLAVGNCFRYTAAVVRDVRNL